jgi:ABC-type Fe3+/spermidine/putrescine transport system ATPase subunit
MLDDAFFEVQNIGKSYDGKIALYDVSFSVKKGEFISILGPSGCGKTTLLSILIGILKPDNGVIRKDSVDITNFDPKNRKMGIVFQNYALFPYMTVLKNVAYPLSIRKETKSTANKIALDLLNRIGLNEHIYKKPNKLSGGQQQRVAIARTLALKPDIVFFDEPMSALDATTRLQLREEIKSIQSEFNITMIYVTHDQEEAFTMSDRIIVMSEGHIEQFDTPTNIITNPLTPFVKEFVVEQINKKIKSLLKFGS